MSEPLTLDQLIERLSEIRKIEGGSVSVYFEDSSGYDSEVTGVAVDHTDNKCVVII